MKTFKAVKPTTLALALTLGANTLLAMAFETDKIKENQTPHAAEFTKLDINADGTLNLAEASRDKLFSRNHFAKADVNHDGALTQDEFSSYKSAEQMKAVGLAVDDSVITTRAKAEILTTKGLKSLDIRVETHKGEVTLSGVVDNPAAKMQAEQVVAKIEGVKSVKNSLEVKG